MCFLKLTSLKKIKTTVCQNKLYLSQERILLSFFRTLNKRVNAYFKDNNIKKTVMEDDVLGGSF